MQLETVYEPQRFEPHWAQWWIDSGIYHVKPKEGPTFSIVIPPPNVTGSLHIGHMLDHTVIDTAVRWHRMKGENTLWLPGTDHAGIATQMVVERQLAKEGLSRRQMGREEFERRVWQWKEEYGGRIKRQMQRIGSSCDWSRERFTMDPGLSRAVRETFVRLWEKGLIYRGEYMVNWCPKCQTAISDVETVHEATEGHLWHIRYQVVGSEGSLVVATTRPETMLGDTALAVHPEDARYTHLHGKTARLPLMNREIPIIADTFVDPKFGTGVVKITPAHDPNDFEAGKRHGLRFIKVIGEDARMTAAAGIYANLDRFEARKQIIAALEESGELVKTEPYTVNLSKCSRSDTVIEPLVSNQWFVSMKPLAEKAIAAVESGQIRFIPDEREAVFYHWMRNIRDWCISRQLWWGHRVPAWHCRNCKEITVARETPAVCGHCQSTEIEQDTDVLDTWFSSGIWPFSTMGWPEQTADLKAFYPTSLLITGFDILFFWVARMIMLGIECTGEVPFRVVHMHGLVRDAQKQKMSKTKGNVIDPLVTIDKFGTDATRIALLISVAPGADISLKDERLKSCQGFVNKLWNASRLLFLNMERSGVTADAWAAGDAAVAPSSCVEDLWIFSRLNHCAREAGAALESHRYHEGAQVLWDFVWHEFCDWYLEVKKLRFQENSGLDSHWVAALTVYEEALRLLHPFAPFVTEELWQRLRTERSHKSISLGAYPAWTPERESPEVERKFALLQEVIGANRELRADNKLDGKSSFDAELSLHGEAITADDIWVIESLTRLKIGGAGSSAGSGGLLRSTPAFSLRIQAEPPANSDDAAVSEARIRIEKEITSLEKVIHASKGQLTDEVFLSKAPEKVVDSLRMKLVGYESQLKKNQDLLEGLR